MKRFLTVALLVAVLCVVGCLEKKDAEAKEFDPCKTALAEIFNKCQVQDQAEENYEPWDYGAYLHLIFLEGKDGSWEIGNLNTYEHQREEFTTLIGAKIYLNRLFKKSDGEN